MLAGALLLLYWEVLPCCVSMPELVPSPSPVELCCAGGTSTRVVATDSTGEAQRLGAEMKWLARGSVCVLALVLLSGSVQADSLGDHVWQNLEHWLDPRTSPFIPIPEIATDPNGGTTVGLLPVLLFTDASQQIRQILAPDLTHNANLGVGGMFRVFSYPSADTQWYALTGASQHIARTVDLLYATGLTRQQRWSFEGRLLFDRDPTDRFFGVGNASKSANETNYTLQQVYADARFGLNLTPVLQVALEARPRFVRIERGAFTSLPFTGTLFPQLKGLGDNQEFLTRVIVSYDTRDSSTIPTHGSQFALFGGISDQHLLSAVSYTLFGVEARQYLALTSQVTLAGHFAARYMPIGKQVPFWALSRIGGDRSDLGYRQPLRGFGDERFVDNNLFAANLELRSRVFELNIFTTHAILELAPFLDTGRVFHNLDDNPLSRLHLVGGLGFRGIAAPFVVGYVDVGYGSEGVAVFSGVNYPF